MNFRLVLMVPGLSPSGKTRKKIGYFVFDITDRMVIVKTFLLCTQNGTWEGNRLNKEYNLSKYSKQYFELDKVVHLYQN
jgi:hypothetical protein